MTERKLKSFWERPEGWTGLITIAGIVGGIGFFAGPILTWVVGILGLLFTAVGQALGIAVIGTILVMFLFVVLNPKVHALAWYAFKGVMRALTSLLVSIDPIGVLKTYIEDGKRNLGKIDDGISKLSAQITRLERRINDYKEQHDQAIKTAKVAQKQAAKTTFTLHARRAGRLEESTVTLEKLLATMKLHLRAMRTFREVTHLTVVDLDDQIKIKQEEREMIMASHSVMQAAKSILRGDQNRREVFDAAMEYLAVDYETKLGEITAFIADSESFVTSLDLDNNRFEADALAKIEAWERRAEAILLPAPSEREAAPVSSDFQKFLK